MRRQYDDHEYDSTYLNRDRLREAAKAYDLIAEVSKETNKSYTLAGILEVWQSVSVKLRRVSVWKSYSTNTWRHGVIDRRYTCHGCDGVRSGSHAWDGGW
jgi:hypothetical protein